jgi:hypothetical protein
MIFFSRLFVFLFYFVLLCGASFSQEVDDDEDDEIYSRIKPMHSLTLEIGLPNPIKNKLFNGWMRGIINFSPYYHYTFENHISLALGANYSYFWINPVASKNNMGGGIHALGSFFKIGHEDFYTDRFGTDIGVKFGGSKQFFDTDYNRAKGLLFKRDVFFIEPTLAFVLTADELTSFRWVFGYMFQNYVFNPTDLGESNQPAYHSKENSVPTNFFTFGFGFSYYFKQR